MNTYRVYTESGISIPKELPIESMQFRADANGYLYFECVVDDTEAFEMALDSFYEIGGIILDCWEVES